MHDHPKTFTPGLRVSEEQQRSAAADLVDFYINRGGGHQRSSDPAAARLRNIEQVYNEVRNAPEQLATTLEAVAILEGRNLFQEAEDSSLSGTPTIEDLRLAAMDGLRGITNGHNALEYDLRDLAIAVLRFAR